MVNRRKVRFPGFLWWRAHADEYHVAPADGFARIRREREPLRAASRGEHLVQVPLVDGNPARLELRDALAVNVRANHIVPGFRQARSRH